jgi:hypothetical protein
MLYVVFVNTARFGFDAAVSSTKNVFYTICIRSAVLVFTGVVFVQVFSDKCMCIGAIHAHASEWIILRIMQGKNNKIIPNRGNL